MRKQSGTVKRDYAFLIMMIVALIVVVAIGQFLPSLKQEDEIIAGVLPENNTETINKLIINEVVTNNAGIYIDENNRLSDFIELYNGTDHDIDLTGYGLSDKKDSVKWLFPEVTIKSKGYLVVNCVGGDNEGLNANFKLSSGGKEDIILVNAHKKIIDGITTVALGKNQSINRLSSGGIMVCDYGTPGQENSLAGLNTYIESLYGQDDNNLVINELLVRNKGNFIDEKGFMYGYIELKNNSEEEINLKDYCLSNDESVPFRYTFEDVVLAPGEIYVINTGDGNHFDDDHLGFNFASKTGKAILSYKGHIINEVSYDGLASGLALIRMDDGKYVSGSFLSKGYENTNEGVDKFQLESVNNYKGLIINELMNLNDEYLAQNGNEYYDWIELYNNSDSTINLADYYITNSPEQLTFAKLPDVELGAGEYYIVMASGNNKLSNKSYTHVDFKLSENESVLIYDGNRIVDSVVISNIPYGYSYGRNENRGWYYISEPTPKRPNNSGRRTVSLNPEFSTIGGIYNDEKSMTISLSGYGDIYYTLDGSEPDKSYGRYYSGPITLNDSTVIKAVVYSSDSYRSEVVTNSYFINEGITLPICSISMDPYDYRILVNNSWSDNELPANIEFYEPNGSFNEGCSIACFGNNARNMAKLSFGIRFKSQYGCSELVYPLFDNRDNSIYQSIVVRSGSNDWTKTIFKDALACNLSDEYVVSQDYKSCVLFVNGNYKGIYNLREKVNAAFISERFNVSQDSVTIVNADLTIKCGDGDFYDEVIYFCQTHDLYYDSNYEYVKTILDIDNVIDFWICQMYCCNPDVNNIRYFKSTELDGGKWKYIFYDLDQAFRFWDKNYYYSYLTSYGMEGFVENVYDNTIPRALFRNAEFKEKWLERLSFHLQNTFTKDRVTEYFNKFVDSYSNDISRDRYFYQGVLDPVIEDSPSMYYYNYQLNDMRSFINNRTRYILNQTRYYFSLSDAKMKELFGSLW